MTKVSKSKVDELYVGTKNKVWGFINNDILKGLMETDMISSQYQSMKRIGRNQNPNVEYYIFTTDMTMVLGTIHELKGITKENINVVEDIMKEEISNSKKTKKDIFIEWITDKLEKKEYKKTKCIDIQKELNINAKTWQRMWQDEEFIKQAKKLRIKQKIEKGKPSILVKY